MHRTEQLRTRQSGCYLTAGSVFSAVSEIPSDELIKGTDTVPDMSALPDEIGNRNSLLPVQDSFPPLALQSMSGNGLHSFVSAGSLLPVLLRHTRNLTGICCQISELLERIHWIPEGQERHSALLHIVLPWNVLKNAKNVAYSDPSGSFRSQEQAEKGDMDTEALTADLLRLTCCSHPLDR